ncbi:MAG: Ig-like domain-containing protein [Gemmatimonadetes bacterium]|nr:Ig-like domain-containing protein [Gemmatimonadota bacterium]
MSRSRRSFPALLLAITLTACAGGSDSANGPTRVTTVDVSPTTVDIAVGATQQLAAAPRNSSGAIVAGKTATWSTSSAAVATVDAAGLVRGVGAGSASISATVDGIAGASSITVTAVPVATVTLAPALLSVPVGGTGTLTATLASAGGTALTGRVVTWASSNTAVATVNASGMVAGVAIGTAVVTATSEGRSGTASITVTPNTATTFTASGRVVEAAGTPGVSGARVTAQDANAAVIATTTADATGNWSLAGLPLGGTVEFVISATGYVSTTVAPITISAAVTVETVPLARSSASTGGVSGRGRDASTNAAIATGIAAELRNGMNTTTGLAVQTTTTAADGTFSFTGVAAGTYTLLMRGAGYAQTSRTVAVTGGATTANADLTLSASANANQWRAVLTWTSASRDLDLYLTLPGAGTTRTQIYFLQPGNCTATPFACLDRDAAVAPGPETVTISQLGTGTYRFYVHNYNTPSSAIDSTLMLSGAQVRIFRGSTQMAAYQVPQQGGTLWTVAELDAATGTLTPRNVMSAGAPGDPVAALRAPDQRTSPTGKRDPGLRLP